METILDDYWRTALKELETTAKDLPQLILDCARLVLEIKGEMKQRHTQWLQRPLSIPTATDLDRCFSRDSTVDFEAPTLTSETRISLGNKRKRDQLDRGCDHGQNERVARTNGNIPLAHDHSPREYRQDHKSEPQPVDEFVAGLAVYHSSVSSEDQESKGMQKGTREKASRIEYFERSLSRSVSVLADCSSVLELFLPQVPRGRLEAPTSTTVSKPRFTTTIGYILTLCVPRVFARPRSKSQNLSRTPPMSWPRVQNEIRAIGQGADEILSAIGRYHSVQCGTKRHREQLDEHHLVHMLSWTREVQAKSVALCELLLQLEPFTLPHRK